MTKMSFKSDNKHKENCQLPPWCSRIKPKIQMNSSYLSDKSSVLNSTNGRLNKYKFDNRRRVPRLQNIDKNINSSRCNYSTKILIIIFIVTAICLVANEMNIPSSIKLILKSKLKESLSVSEECHARLTQLQAALSRTEYALKRKWRRNGFFNYKDLGRNTDSDSNLMEGATVTINPGTKEWADGRVTLWGVIPLWRTSPSPYTVLATRKLVPGDCWPFIGSRGEVTIELSRRALVSKLGIQHIRPDSANSAPKQFSVYVTLENGTYMKNFDEEYKRGKNAYQLYDFKFKKAIKKVTLEVLSNHGNRNYTCIYRLYLHGQFLDIN